MSNSLGLFIGILLYIQIPLFSVHSQEISTSATSDFSKIEMTPSELLPPNHIAEFEDTLVNDAPIVWKAYFPSDYNQSTPPGLLVYTSPGLSLIEPHNWTKIAEENNLIWIYAEKSGRKATVPLRILLAELTYLMAKQTFDLNLERIYAAGDGGITSQLIMQNSTDFNGAIFSGDIPWIEKDQPKIRAMKNSKIVFIIGSEQKASNHMQNVYNEYKKLGVKNTKLTYLEENHIAFVKLRKISQSIKFLDRPES